jgi:pterin-4a-carbinolamine dehydratase
VQYAPSRRRGIPGLAYTREYPIPATRNARLKGYSTSAEPNLKNRTGINVRKSGEKIVTRYTMAEEQSHHPDIFLTWGKAGVEVWTHKIDGLTESDFIFAAKTDEIWKTAEGRRS